MKKILLVLVLMGAMCAAATHYTIWGIGSAELSPNAKVVDRGTEQLVSFTSPGRITATLTGKNDLTAVGTAVIYARGGSLIYMTEKAAVGEEERNKLIYDCPEKKSCNILTDLPEKSTLKETRYVTGKFSDSFRLLPLTTLGSPKKTERPITTKVQKTAEGLYSVLVEWKRSIDYSVRGINSFVPLYPISISKGAECSTQSPMLVRKIELVQRERIAVSAKNAAEAKQRAEAIMKLHADTLDEIISDKCPRTVARAVTGAGAAIGSPSRLLTIATLYRLAEDPDLLGANEPAFKIFKKPLYATASAAGIKVSYELNPLAEETSVKVYLIPEQYRNFFDERAAQVYQVFLGMLPNEKACAASEFAELPSPEKPVTECFSRRTFAKPSAMKVVSYITEAGKTRTQTMAIIFGDSGQILLLSSLKSSTLQKARISWDTNVGINNVFAGTLMTGTIGKLLPGNYIVIAEATDSAGTETLEERITVSSRGVKSRQVVGQYLIRREGSAAGECTAKLISGTSAAYWPSVVCKVGGTLNSNAKVTNPVLANTVFTLGSTVAALTPVCGDEIACPCVSGPSDCAYLTVLDSSVLGAKATS